MAPTAAASEDKTTTDEDDAGRMEMTPSPVRHIHHQAYACWDSEETRHFYEDILEMPLIATVVIEDPFRTDASAYCYTFFEIGDGDTLAFFEHTSMVHPKRFNARSACFIATSRSKWKETRRWSSSSAGWMRLASRTRSRI
jgi:hypothetical protein